MAWTPVPADHPAYPCFDLDAWVRFNGFDTGPLYIELTYGGTHSDESAHYPRNGARARDFWGDYHAIADWLVPYADGDAYIIEELFCSETAVAWSHGAPSGFHDAGGHTHAALRPGAKLPMQQRKDDEMGALGGDSIRPGESIPFRLLPPGGGAIGPIADPVYLSIPFDQLGGPPASVRWAICDQGGKVIDSNDKDRNATPVPWPCSTPGFLIQAHAGAFILTVENKEKAGGRIVGGPVQEWAYAKPAAAMAAEAPAAGATLIVKSDDTGS